MKDNPIIFFPWRLLHEANLIKTEERVGIKGNDQMVMVCKNLD
jgi:hypothetical protein